MKSETVHAVFAEVEHQRAEHDQGRLDGDPAQQKRQRLDHHARNQGAYAAVTKKCEKHFGCPVEIGATVPTQRMTRIGSTISPDDSLLPLPLGEGWGEGLRSHVKNSAPSPGSLSRSDLSPPGRGELRGSTTHRPKHTSGWILTFAWLPGEHSCKCAGASRVNPQTLPAILPAA